MSDEIITLLSLAVSVPVSIAYYRKVMGGNSKKDKLIRKAKKHGCVVTAVAGNTEYLYGDPNASSLEDRSPSMLVKYEYQVDGVTYRKQLRFQKFDRSLISYPDRITIYYDPAHPRKAACLEETPQWVRKQNGCLGAAAIWLVLYIVLGNVLKLVLR